MFKNRFSVFLEQDEDKDIQPPEDTGDEVLSSEIDPETAPQDYGANVEPGKDIESIKQRSLESQKQELTTWINKIDEFVEFINGVNDTSVQSKLHNAGCDSMFEKIASSEHKKVARVAVDLSALAEALRGYLIAGDQ